jgi:hypothetical protein
MTSKGRSAPGRPPIDPDVARFAAALRAQEQEREAEAERRAAQRQRQAEEEAERNRHDDLRNAKDRAAAALRDARRTGRSAEVSAAEAAYRTALAELLAFETGSRPSWSAAGETDPSGAPGGVEASGAADEADA